MQRVFDIENEKDYADLWDILPDDCLKLPKGAYDSLLAINWHDKTEITRPIQEATIKDFKKLCLFRDDISGKGVVGVLSCIDSESACSRYYMNGGTWWKHCRRLTKQEIEELC